MKEKTIKISDKLINFFLLAVVFLTPLFFNPLTFLSFEIDKIVLARILTESALFFFLLKIILQKKMELPREKNFYLAISLIFFIQVLSAFFSGHIYQTFWGSYFRGMGIFTYLHLYLFAFLVFVRPIAVKKIFGIITLSAFIISLYGLAQVAGFDFLEWQENLTGLHYRASSTLGQPNYLGGYLLFTLPLAFYFFLVLKKTLYKICLAAVFFIEFAAFYFTYSRAAWLGFVISLFVFLAVYAVRKFGAAKTLIGLVVFLLFIYISGFILSGLAADRWFFDRLSVPERIMSLKKIGEGSAGIRLYYYDAALNIIRERPIIGRGPDTQSYYFAHYYAPYYAILERINTYPDRAHNEILDILITTGLLGLLAWFFLFYILAGQLVGNDKSHESILEYRGTIAVLLFGLCSFAVYLLFSFITAVSAIYLWLFLALLFRLSARDKKEMVLRFSLKAMAATIIIPVLFFLLVFSIYVFNLKFTIADYYHRRARVAFIKGDIGGSYENYIKSIELLPGESYYPEQMAAQLHGALDNLPDAEAKRLSLEDLRGNLDRIGFNQLNFEGKAYLAIVSGLLSEYGEADRIFSTLADDYPGFARIYLDWGNSYFDRKDYKTALEKYYFALTRYPGFDDPGLNIEHKEAIVYEMLMVYKKIVRSEIALKNFKRAEELNSQALKLSPFDFELLDLKNVIFASKGKKEDLLLSLKHFSALFPGNQDIQKQLKLLSGQ
ncbi:MAG: O-antigen ligase family protein [Patescibacteria group bacterium]